MEQQKILWIILSVAVLLLAVLGTALFILSPASSADDSAGSIASARVLSTNSFDPVEWARTSRDYPGIEDIPAAQIEDEFVVIYGDNADSAAAEKETETKESVVIIAAPAPRAAPQTAPAPVPRPAPQTAPAPAPAPQTAPALSPTPAQVTEYWIQAGSFTSLSRAEDTRSILVSNGLGATLQTRTVNNQLFYRVRIGPYVSKEEAEKFLYWVKGLEGFMESYVSQVQAIR